MSLGGYAFLWLAILADVGAMLCVTFNGMSVLSWKIAENKGVAVAKAAAEEAAEAREATAVALRQRVRKTEGQEEPTNAELHGRV